MKRMIIGILMILVLNQNPVYSETVLRDVFNVYEDKAIVISVMWEEGDVFCELISPSGQVIGVDTKIEDVIVKSDERAYYFILKKPEKGAWKISYDKGTNDYVDIFGDYYIEPIWITQFDVGLVDANSTLPVSFFVDGEGRNMYYGYVVSIGTTDQSIGKKELFTSSASSDQLVEKNVSVLDVNSYTDYVIYLDITYDINGYEYYDFVSSEPFEVLNTSNPVEVEDYAIWVDQGSGEIKVEIQPSEEVVDGYTLMMFEDGSKQPVNIYEFDLNDPSIVVPFNYEASDIRIKIVSQNGGIFSKGAEATITTFEADKSLANVQWVEAEVLSYSGLVIPFTKGDDTELSLSVNGHYQKLETEATGNLVIQLNEGENMIDVYSWVGNYVAYKDSKTYIYDPYPPQLMIYEDINGLKTTSEMVDIFGNVEQSAVLSINEQTIEPDETGDFIYEYLLVSGANEIEVLATDRAGNVSSYNAKVTRKTMELKEGSWIVLIIGVPVALALLLIYWFTGRKKRK